MNTETIENFIADVCAGKRNQTPLAYRGKLSRLLHWMDDRSLTVSDLTMQHIEQFRRSLLEQSTVQRGNRAMPGHLSPFTIHTVLRTVKHFLRWSYEKGLICFDPTSLKIHPPPPPDPKPVTAENALALLYAAARFGEAWEQARNLAILYTLRDTAARIGAILSADIDNLDLTQGKLFVTEKGNKPHVLHLTEPTITAICEWLKHRPGLHPLDHALFLSQKGTQLSYSGWASTLLRIRQAAGLQGRGRTNNHAFRHAWVRDALQSGMDLSRASQILNHSNSRVTTDYYARWADGELHEAHSQYSPGANLPIIFPVSKSE